MSSTEQISCLYLRDCSAPLPSASMAPNLAVLLASTLPPNASSHHRWPDGTALQPSLQNSFKRLALPSRSLDIFLAWMKEGGGFSWEYETPWVGASENPCNASTTAGGTVIRPILKQSRETATAWRTVSSDSSMTFVSLGLSPWEAECRPLSVSVAEDARGLASVSGTFVDSLWLLLPAASRFDFFRRVTNFSVTCNYKISMASYN